MGSYARPDWTPEQLAKLKELCESGHYRFDKMAIEMGRPMRGVMWKCYEQGLNNRYRNPPKYTYNTSFFRDITYETCYWAAILTTDGCIMWRNGRPIINWSAAIKDIDHMNLYRGAIGSNHPIIRGRARCQLSTKDPLAYHEYGAINLENAVEWTQDLEVNFGIRADKTLRCPPPNLSTLKHRLCYIRGFIDGDGAITCSNQEGAMQIMVCGINRSMIEWIKITIDRMNLPRLGHGTKPSSIYTNGENCHYFLVRGFKAAVLFDLMKRLPAPNLARKWDNPRILTIVDYWKRRPEWPAESFFTDMLSDSGSNLPEPLKPHPEKVYTPSTTLA